MEPDLPLGRTGISHVERDRIELAQIHSLALLAQEELQLAKWPFEYRAELAPHDDSVFRETQRGNGITFLVTVIGDRHAMRLAGRNLDHPRHADMLPNQ
jgi:hypothetical protein